MFQSSLCTVSFLWVNSAASFVNLDSPVNYLQFGLFVILIMFVTAKCTNVIQRFKFRMGVSNMAMSFLSGGSSGKTEQRASAMRSKRQQTFTRNSWPVYALMMATCLIWFTQTRTNNSKGNQSRTYELAAFTGGNTTKEATITFADEKKPEQYFNQSPKGKPKSSSLASAPNQPQTESNEQAKPLLTSGPEFVPVLTDTKSETTTLQEQQTYTVQVSVGSVEKYVLARAKQVAGLLSKHRVYMYPDQATGKIKILLGTFTDKAAAEEILLRYQSLSGERRGFVTGLPVAESDLYIVPG
ncbi:MAG: hypothetical protein AAFZ63_19690 [Bacteroidota bacterium]